MRATEGEPPASIERRWHLHGIACAANQCDYDRFSEALYLWNRDHGRTRNRRVNFEHQTHGGEAVMRYVLKHETRYLDHSAHKARSMEFSEEPYYPAITVDRHRRIAASF